MDALGQLECLFEKGLITAAQYATASKLAAVLPYDIDAIFAIMSSASLSGSNGAPISMTTLSPIDEVTPQTIPLVTGASRVVATVIGNDALFSVISGTPPAAGAGHVMKDGVNYTFTAEEWANFQAIAIDNSATVSLTVTFYK